MNITPIESWIRPQDERFSIQPGQVQRITAQDLVGSDTGLNGSVISLRSVGQASHGTLSLNSDGSYSYSPAAGYVGNDSFSYTVQDQFGNTCTETVHINVCPPDPIPVPNQAPVVMDEFVNVTAGSPVSAHESSLLANDSDPDGNPLSIQSYGQPAHGSLSRAADGTLTYTAHADYSGEDSFTYVVSDGQGGLTQGTVHLNVAACAHNRPPVVMGEEAALRAGSNVSAPESLLLANDSDPEGGAVSLVPTGYSQPAHGTLTRAADGTLTYTPKAGFVGDDSFTYTVTDAQGNTSQGTVTLHVGPGMAAPTITTVDDNVGPTQGNVSKGGSTDDTTPTLGGTAEPGARVDVYDGTTLLGSTQAGANGQWTLTPSTPLATGPHNFQVRATAADGASADSNAYDINITTGNPLSAPVVSLLDDANNDGTLTRNELNGNSRVDVRVDLPADSRVGDLLQVQDNDGHGVSKRLTQADLDAKSVRFDDAFPLPAPNTTLVVSAQITGADGRSTPPGTDSAFFNGNFSPLGQDDVARLNSASTPIASLLGMSQDTAEVVPGGQTWTTSDGDAGRAVYGLLSSLLSPGMKVQVSSSDQPGVWFDAVVSADGLHWTAVDTQAHASSWSYSARVLSPAGTTLSSSAVQVVELQGAAAGSDGDLSQDNVLSYDSQAALQSALWSKIEGGAGVDTLRLTGTDMRLELPRHSSTPAVAQDINNIECFDLGLGGRNTLEMSINDVLAQGHTNAFLPNGKTQVMVNGDSSDTLSLVQLVGHGGDSGNWARTGSVQIDGKTYSVFEHSTLGGQVLAQQGLKVQVPAEPGTPAATAELPTTSGNVLANDSDPDGPAAGLRVAGVDNKPGVTPGENLGTRLEGLYGHLTLNPDGSYRYVADKSFGLTAPQVDVFYYLPKDGEGETALQPSRLSFEVQPAQANVLSVQGGDPAVEGETLSFTVNISNSPNPTAMTLELLSGSATVGQDTTGALQADLGQGWVDVVGGAVTVPAGTTSFQVRLTTVNDAQFEQTEGLSLRVTSGNGTAGTGSVSILDNDLVSQVVGTENEPITLGWAELGLNQIESDVSHIVLTAIPTNGYLHVRQGDNWEIVTAPREISRADIEAGNLRFLPDGYEAGIDGYQAEGLGNRLNDYDRISFNAISADGSAHPNCQVKIDIAPKAELGSLSLVVATGNPEFGYGNSTLVLSGSTSDRDGSERILVGFTFNTVVTMTAVDKSLPIWSPNAYPVTPDKDGIYWVRPESNLSITTPMDPLTMRPIPWSGSASVYVQEVNSQGMVLDQVVSAPFYINSGTRQPLPGGSCPIVLDLDGNGVQTVGVEHGVRFDLSATGEIRNVGWTDGQDGLLALDRNGNGRIDDGAELFGQGTTLANGDKAPDGFVALAEADDNGDGVINAQDAVFAQLQVWVDANTDGVTQAGELKGLAELGVVEFKLQATPGTEVQNGNLLGLLSDYTTADGQRHDLVDVWFEVAPEADTAALKAADLLQSPSTLEQATAAEATELGQRASIGQMELMAQHGLRHAGLHLEPELQQAMH